MDNLETVLARKAGLVERIAHQRQRLARDLRGIQPLIGAADKGAELLAGARRHAGLLAAAGGRVDAVFYCPHGPEEACQCRKPQPGLFEQIRDRYGMDLKGVPTVGDSLRDLQAGAAAGCDTHLVLTGKGEALRGQALPAHFPADTRVHADLSAFADWLLGTHSDGGPIQAVARG